MKKFLYRSILFLFVFSQVTIIYLYKVPQLTSNLSSANLTSASATLSNSRLSFYGRVTPAHNAGDTTIALDGTGNPDNDTNHLFPNDTVSIGPNGNFTVGSIINSLNFALSAGLTVGANDQAAVYATQSGALAVTFTITNDIPVNGYVLVTIPDPASGGNDGAPDTGATASVNGFDLNGMATTDIVTTGGTGCTWSTETLTAGSGSGHRYKVLTTTACTAGAITVTFDGATKDLVNPAPPTAHSQGTADTYSIDVDTYDGDPDSGGLLIDYANVKVAPIEGVLVSATVDETLSFVVAGITTDIVVCGITRTASSPDSTAFSIPWGTIPSTYVAATHNAAQQLTVSTNALSGYKVYIEENDQMGRNGNVCTGATPGADGFTFTAGTCIRDTLCGATACSHTAAYDWGATPGTYYGFGYSLANQAGTDAKFLYNSSASPCTATAGAGNFCAKTPADQEASEARADTGAEIMTSGVPVSGSSVYACYRIAVGGTQPAGYYYNKVKYTAVATF